MQAAFEWMSTESDSKPLILSSAETGLLIPGATGWRVVYGHPYETPQADFRKLEVDAVFSGELSPDYLHQFITENGIDYIFYGPFEQDDGVDPAIFAVYPAVYDNDGVKIYLTGAGR